MSDVARAMDRIADDYRHGGQNRTEVRMHQQGRHVQHAHGRRTTLANDASADAHQGGMIALMPTPADAKRLALRGGEAAAELHCTLFFLGGDVSDWSDAQADELRASLAATAQALGPVQSKIFGIAHWNAGGSSPSWVWSVGDNPEADTTDCGLDRLRYEACAALEDMHTHADSLDSAIQTQHSPWVAHICAAYTDDLTLAKELEKRNGPVTFDRIRLSLGDQDWDFPLEGGPVTAAASRAHLGEFRRQLTATEAASRFDFAGHQQGWKQAVNGALADWSGVEAAWRGQLRDQIAAGVTELHLDTSSAEDLLYQRMLSAAQAAGRAQQRAAEQQGVTVPPWTLGEDDTVTASGMSRLARLRLIAKLTADVQASRLVDSAKRKLMALLSVFSGLRLASEVDAFLQTLSQAFARDGLGAAMTAAQGIGQQAVLSVAPRATYYATELLDDRTCSPCGAVDGKAFSSLADAETAYPSGGYVDCDGGGRCRGQIVAVWDKGMTAAALEAGMLTDQEMGGKPSTGTKPDKRLKENKMDADLTEPCPTCPGDEHFHTGDVVELAWDGSASRFSDAEYKRAAAACDPGDGTVKERCFLPHHDPDGALNRDGLAAAAGRASGLKGHDPAAVERAKAHLRAHYHQIGEDVPPNIAASSVSQTFDDGITVQCPPGWNRDPDSDGCLPPDYTPGTKVTCPQGWIPDDDGDGCIPAQLVATTAAGRQVVDPPEDGGSQTAPWSGVLVVEGVTTGDGREFAPGALTWRDLPIPLRWNRVDSHGGEPRTEAVNVGRIDSIERVGNELRGSGVFDLSTPDGQTAYGKVKNQMLRGVSIDADSISDPDIEFVWPDNPNEGEDEEADIFAMLFAQPEKVIFHGGRISAATLCDIPAFAEAYVALTDDQGAVVAGGAMEPEEWRAAQPEPAERPAVVAHAAPFAPPAEWFTNPQLSLPTPITVDDQGRVYGHAAQWGTCHIGQTGQCVQPPRENEHPYFMTGEVDTAEGGVASVGQITVGTGHAPLHVGAQAATEHYDHTGWAVADVAVGNDSHGIWVAGCIRADADPAKVAALRAAGQVSGDWRRIGGKLRLVGLLAVNVPGFPVPRMRARVAGGAQYALVAAGQPTVAPGVVASGPSEDDLDQQAMRRVMDMLSRRVKEN